MNKQQLASKIWESANKMRSKIEAGEYKDYIIGFMFYKFLSEEQVKFLKEKHWTDEDIKELSEEDTQTVEFVQRNIGYFIAYNNLFSTWIEKGLDFDLSDVRDALNAFSRLISNQHKKVFDRIFNTLETGLNKLGVTASEQTKAIKDLIQVLKIIPMNNKQDYDVLGFIYEYLISNFAVNAGKKAGEFYTPHEVSVLMSDIVADHLKNNTEIKIYDPTSGSGSLLINIGYSIQKHTSNRNNIKYYAQELKENTYNLTRMNLVMHGILPDNIVARNADTLENDWPLFDESDSRISYDPLLVDAVVSNPPYSLEWNRDNKESDPRYSEFGLAPKGKADYAFLLHDLYHVKTDGIMTIVLPHGVLFRAGEEGEIRKNLVEKNHIDTIIGLPADIFFGTGIPTIIMVLKKSSKENTDILMIDASKGFVKVGNKNQLRASDIKKITDTVINRESVDNFSRVVSLEEIRKNDYNLNITRYVDTSEATKTWDIHSLMYGGIPKSELKVLENYWNEFPSLKNDLFEEINDAYYSLKNKDIKTVMSNNWDVINYLDKFKNNFKDLDLFLETRLISNMNNLNIVLEQEDISNEIFDRLKDFKLLDKYKAYQALEDEWVKTSIDLEIIQSEGFDAIRKVDPKMIIRKKGIHEEEYQEGWMGRIIPFEVVQKNLLNSELTSLEDKENRLNEIESEFQEIIEQLTDEEKERSFSEEGNKFDTKKVKHLIKVLDVNQEEDELFKSKLIRYSDLKEEEKELKINIKRELLDLQDKTKIAIESLTDLQAKDLLKQKWIKPITEAIAKLPNDIINTLVSLIVDLDDKYNVTFSDIVNEIKDNQNTLLSLIDDLEGDEYDMKGLSELKSLLKGK
ncbi:type I restriction enzyme M protein [Mycoplasma testudineum]|uniref:site-specific DNA-methyltransferase (adenine-specific) n=1 Tax=Mycoplasma testudineum TaxID=244584 RepID=A0A4R6IH50_9MOLU|nr:type I restriction-modification system subunit M [Mycoplasma testudineum]OYD26415.1 type I restriction-modification system subunit M [Mycoplasma testudineum]TDO21246.1 type I restriction enzyme M protein [Mycoplasma testudineum]